MALESSINLVESALGAAQEFDNNLLDLGENDVKINSLVVRSIVVFSKLQEKKLLSNEQVTKIANYFLTSKSQDLAQIVQALTALNNEPSPLPKPVSFSRVSDFPKTTLSMVDVFGQKVESARFLVGVDNGDL